MVGAEGVAGWGRRESVKQGWFFLGSRTLASCPKPQVMEL